MTETGKTTETHEAFSRNLIVVYYIKGIQKSFLRWYIYAAFDVHSNFNSYKGSILTMGKGSIISMSQKQKLDTKRSTEAELVGTDDTSSLILRNKLFLEA